MWLKNVNYLISCPSKENWPDNSKKELCIVGRSNVGKSTLINKITNNRNMAKVSKTPGLTKYLNFFDVNHQYRLVDSPGYGYAKVSIQSDASFQKMMSEYLYERDCLIGLILVIDAKIGITANDLSLLQIASSVHLPVHIIASKCDKLNQKMKHQLNLQIQEIQNAFDIQNIIYYSSLDHSYEKVVDLIKLLYQEAK